MRARIAGLVLLTCAAAAPASLLAAAVWESPFTARLSSHPTPVHLLVCGVALVTVVVFERPRSASAIAYARQLRARFLELESMYDADKRRRLEEGKEKEDDRVSSEP